MASLETYRRGLSYTYALGLFPALEALTKRPDLVRRMLVSSKMIEDAGMERVRFLCGKHGIRIETADRLLGRLSRKENCFAAAVVTKSSDPLWKDARHLMLHNPADKGNLGTILRTALGFHFVDVALVRPCADPNDPQVIRASMGAAFSMRIAEYDSFEAYLAEHPGRVLYPFMLDGAVPLEAAAQNARAPYTLIMGNEGSGLPASFASLGTAVVIPHSDAIDSLNLSVAAGIGMYAFARQGKHHA